MNQSSEKNYFQTKGIKAEKFVQELAKKTFLVDWCFLNPKLPDGKELCDLLVVFDNVVIIWQIKDLKIHENGKYKKSEVEKNLRQISGARRQLFDLNTKINLQNVRRSEEIFNPSLIEDIYLISVLLGENENYFSLIDEIKNNKVHIFTRDFITIILNELDTISDFIEYLKSKEDLINNVGSILLLGGEEELLAFYLMNYRNLKRLYKHTRIMIQEGLWDELQTNQKYVEKRKADEISYGWDAIIDRAHEGGKEYELIARELARPNRFERRYLSKAFIEAHIFAHNEKKHHLFRRIMPAEGITFCFLFQDDPEPRNKRKKMLLAICYVARGKFIKNKKVLGIATEMKIKTICSYDFILLDLPTWTDENKKILEQLQKETGIFVNPNIKHVSEDEYPKFCKD